MSPLQRDRFLRARVSAGTTPQAVIQTGCVHRPGTASSVSTRVGEAGATRCQIQTFWEDQSPEVLPAGAVRILLVNLPGAQFTEKVGGVAHLAPGGSWLCRTGLSRRLLG